MGCSSRMSWTGFASGPVKGSASSRSRGGWGSLATPSDAISPAPGSAFKIVRPRGGSTRPRNAKSNGSSARVAEGNTVVVQQELAAQGIEVELRTLQRAVAPLASGGPRPGPGHRPVRDQAGSTNADRLRPEDRGDRRRARDGPPHDRRPGLLAAAVLPGLPRRTPGRLARGHRRGLPPFRRTDRADPLRQRLAAGDLARPRDRRGRLASRLRGLLQGSRHHPARLPSATCPDQGEDRTRRRLRQAQRPGRAVVRRVRGPADGTWRSGSSRSPTDAFTARRTNNRSSVSSATNARHCGPCRLGRWRCGRDAWLDA